MASLTFISYPKGSFKCKEVSGHFQLTEDLSTVEHYGDYLIKTTVSKGYEWDGASTPVWLRWFLPKFDKKNELYNVVALLHDVRYGARGFCLVDREETDDMLRGGWRIAGLGRFKASSADYFIEKIAESHWGNDDYKCSHLAKMEMKLWKDIYAENLSI